MGKIEKRKPANTSVTEVNNLLKGGVQVETIKRRPTFKVDGDIKREDDRWNYNGMSKALANLFSVARVERDENDNVIKDVNGNPSYSVNVMNICIEMVKWLVAYCCHKNFRKASRNDIFSLAKDMANNKWRLTSNSVIVSPRNFDVVDGQHRLIAFLLARIINPNCIVPLKIEFADYDPAIIDTGKKRTLRDLFHGNHVANSNTMAAAMQQIWAHFTGTANCNSGKTQGTNSLILDILPIFKVDCHNAVKLIEKHNQRNGNERIGSHAKVSGLFAIFSMIDIETSDLLMKFMHRENGVLVPSHFDNLVTVMRKGASAKSDDKERYLNYRQLNAALICAWNHLYAGRAMPSKAKWSDTRNHYPEIEGMKKLALNIAYKSDNGSAMLAMLLDGKLYNNHVKVYNVIEDAIKDGKATVDFAQVASKVKVPKGSPKLSKVTVKSICQDLTKANIVKVTPITTKVKFDAKKTATVKA